MVRKNNYRRLSIKIIIDNSHHQSPVLDLSFQFALSCLIFKLLRWNTLKWCSFHSLFQHIPYILGLNECKRSTPLQNIHYFDCILLQKLLSLPVISNYSILMSFAPRKLGKVSKYSLTSPIILAIKRCFYFSNFRYGFPVHITYIW